MVTTVLVIAFWVIVVGAFLALVWWVDKPRRDLIADIKKRPTMTVYSPRISRFMRKASDDG